MEKRQVVKSKRCVGVRQFLMDTQGAHKKSSAEPRIFCAGEKMCVLFYIQHGDFRDGPAVIRAGDLELHHRDGVGGTAHNA